MAAAVVGAAAATAGKVVHERRAKRVVEESRELQLRPDEGVPDAIRRVARGQIDEARDQLREHPDDDLADAIHEARKALKRARAIARLARDGVGDETYRRDNGALRYAGRALAPARDAEVLVETLDDVRERFADELPPDPVAELRGQLAAERVAACAALASEGTVRAVLGQLDASRRRVTTWAFADDGFAGVEPGLRRIYRRGRRAYRAARDERVPERFHEWRKRTKDLWYAAQALREGGPKPMKKLARNARSLSKVLGEHHDLSVLREHVLRHRATLDPPTADALVAVIDRRRERLEARALAAGAELYAEQPRKFTRRIARRWDKRLAAAG